jgi:arylsulfatase A-like enzyme
VCEASKSNLIHLILKTSLSVFAGVVLFSACSNKKIEKPDTISMQARCAPSDINVKSSDELSQKPLEYCKDADSCEVNSIVLISVDGLGHRFITKEDAPFLKVIMKKGVSLDLARTIYPSITLPSHTSMLTGVSPEKHGIDWNSYQPQRVHNGNIQIPTIFDLAKKNNLSTAMLVGKEKFKHLGRIKPDPGLKVSSSASVDYFEFEDSNNEAYFSEKAVNILKNQKPDLFFIHFRHPDITGHSQGWGSLMQKQAIKAVDLGISKIYQAMSAKNSKSVMIVTADHGGHKGGHGGCSSSDLSIPWIAYSESINPLGETYYLQKTFDTASTVAELLGLSVPGEWGWDGKPVFKLQ